MQDKFGVPFEAYCADVPRWLPRLRGIRQAFANGAFHWRRLIVKEHGTPFGWINGLCSVVLYHLWKEGALETYEPLTQAMHGDHAAGHLAMMTARTLKKTRKLVAD